MERKTSELMNTAFGYVFTAELEDGSVEAVSAEAAEKSLHWILGAANLPDDFDSRPLEVIVEYLRGLVAEYEAPQHTEGG
jgi:hypothetical protein